MAHLYPDAEIRRMPGMVLRAIRHGKFIALTEELVPQIQALSRTVNRAAEAGHDMLPAMSTYASYVDACMPRLDPDKPWTEEMSEIHNVVWPFVASPYALRCHWMGENGVAKSIEHLDSLIKAWVAQLEAEKAMPLDQADAEIRAEMVRVSGLFPNLGLSYGYIGNIWHAPFRDDRTFKVFSQVKHPGDLGCYSFGYHDVSDLPKLHTKVMAGLEGWARDLDAKLAAGTIVLNSTRHLEAPRKAA
jgi:hypothetical protein